VDVYTAVPIGLIVNELLANALKYTFPQGKFGKITLSLEDRGSNTFELHIIDNGIGKTEGVKPQGIGFGTKLVSLLTKQLNGELEQKMDNGTIISIYFKKGKAA
jgi:two-component sensor histidine kinase